MIFQVTFSHPHRFERYNYTTPTYCDICNSVLWGPVKTGVRCQVKQFGKIFVAYYRILCAGLRAELPREVPGLCAQDLHQVQGCRAGTKQWAAGPVRPRPAPRTPGESRLRAWSYGGTGQHHLSGISLQERGSSQGLETQVVRPGHHQAPAEVLRQQGGLPLQGHHRPERGEITIRQQKSFLTENSRYCRWKECLPLWEFHPEPLRKLTRDVSSTWWRVRGCTACVQTPGSRQRSGRRKYRTAHSDLFSVQTTRILFGILQRVFLLRLPILNSFFCALNIYPASEPFYKFFRFIQSFSKQMLIKIYRYRCLVLSVYHPLPKPFLFISDLNKLFLLINLYFTFVGND